jgi:hypothetical protein
MSLKGKNPHAGAMPPATDADAAAAAAPLARRVSRPSWRDPRLVVGVVLVAGSVLAGAALLGGGDGSVSVWALRTDLADGSPVAASDLVAQQVGFLSTDEADRYLSAATAIPEGSTLVRAVGAGELLPRAALGASDLEPVVEVPVPVAAEAVPATVVAGSRVDVYVTADVRGGERVRSAQLVFDDVLVVAEPQDDGALGQGLTRQIILGLDASQDDELGPALARTSSGTVVVTRRR